MTYREWADDYLNESVKLKAKITEIKEQMPSMPVQALQIAEQRVRSLYTMYLDCLYVYGILSKRAGGFIEK